jgi:hypothetical protein
VTAPFQPAGAAEFPNDNPSLHDGARWVCPDTVGPTRAIVRPRALGGAVSVVAAEPAAHAAAPEPAPPVELAAPLEPAPPERRYQGPLELDLGRIVLVHRVENIPPPPDFIFRPFVRSPRREVSLGEAVVAALADPSAASLLPPAPIEPRPCRSVDERDAGRRIERGWRVDVAPCLSIGTSAEALRARLRRRGISTTRALPPGPAAPVPLELEAVGA